VEVEPIVARVEEGVVVARGRVALEYEHLEATVAPQGVAAFGDELEQHSARVGHREVFGGVGTVQRPRVDDLVAVRVDELDRFTGVERERDAISTSQEGVRFVRLDFYERISLSRGETV
jgi:hypothetical protein